MDWRIIQPPPAQRRKRAPSKPNGSTRKTKRAPGKQSGRVWSPSHRSQDRIFQETFVYLMTNIPFFMVNKFGISDKTVARVKNVSETTPGLVKKILALNLAFGFEVEQFVHRVYKLQNVHFWTGSGRTEWFIVFSPIVGVSMLYLNHRFGVVGWFDQTFNTHTGTRILWLSFFTPFVWWDGLLWLLFFRALKMLVIIAAILFMFYAIAHIK